MSKKMKVQISFWRYRVKKTFYCVMSEFYDDGTVKAAMISRVCEEKPKGSCRRLPKMEAYNIWFDTEPKAAAYMTEVKAMNSKQEVVA